MKTTRHMPVPALAGFALGVTVMVGERNWEQITKWQREGLVSIKPVTKQKANVTLTAKGRVAAGLDAAEAAD